MAYQKKVYRNGKSRGGIKGTTVDSSFGAAGNRSTSKKNYPRNDLIVVKKK